MATWTTSSGEQSVTWTHSPDEIVSTWVESSGEQSSAWLHTELMQYGFLSWGGISYNWEDVMAYVDSPSTEQDESSGKWEDLG